MTISIDGTMPSSAGEMIPTTGTNSAPARPGHARREHVGDELDARRVVAEEAHAVLVVARGDEQPPVAREHERARRRGTTSSSDDRDDEVERSAGRPGSATVSPKNVWKFVRPFVPPVSERLPTMTITNAPASAWLRIAKYAPRMRWRKIAAPSSAAIAIGSRIAIGTANHADAERLPQRRQRLVLAAVGEDVGQVAGGRRRRSSCACPCSSRRARRTAPGRARACRPGPTRGRCRSR